MNERLILRDKKPEIKSRNAVPQIRRKTESIQSLNSPVDRILFLQRTIGNHAVARLMKSGTLQRKNETSVLPPVPKYELTMPSIGQTFKELLGQKPPDYFPRVEFSPELKLRLRGMSPEFKDDFLKMRGVTNIRYNGATLGGAGKLPVPAAPSSGPTAGEEKPPIPPILALDFEIEPEKGSELERVLNQEKILSMLLNKEDENTPLGLKLLSTGISALAAPLQGKGPMKKLHLTSITVIANPSEGKYGLWGLIVGGEF